MDKTIKPVITGVGLCKLDFSLFEVRAAAMLANDPEQIVRMRKELEKIEYEALGLDKFVQQPTIRCSCRPSYNQFYEDLLQDLRLRRGDY